ncbi:uncharacterized protein LOC113783729 [Coffea eugenioides]|uniref:uncharacterized protein LOC113783729 n=1 Tax=Coffea eugenioides TaxID=49369 RepID=UPI000F605467|nr:uncharacterized protein LOC113783729 [Coffea eugenioides]
MSKTGAAMHVKSDSEVTSIDQASTPPRSPRRPLYYVQSPSHSHHHNDVDKMSYGSSPFASPAHPHCHYNYHYPHYHCSPIHHSRESSTSRFSAKFPALGWRRIQTSCRLDDDDDHRQAEKEDDDDQHHPDDDEWDGSKAHLKFYVLCFLLCFLVLFTIFSLILWAASASYHPKTFVKNIVFENFNVQAGMDRTGVPTDMLTLNSTVKIFFRNPATFFGVHVTATPLQLYYYDLKVASGLMKKFYQSRKSQQIVMVVVQGYQVPLYGGVPVLSGAKGHLESASVPLNLTFKMRSRAYVLGRLVKPKFYRSIICAVTLRGNHLGKPVNLTNSDKCVYK